MTTPRLAIAIGYIDDELIEAAAVATPPPAAVPGLDGALSLPASPFCWQQALAFLLSGALKAIRLRRRAKAFPPIRSSLSGITTTGSAAVRFPITSATRSLPATRSERRSRTLLSLQDGKTKPVNGSLRKTSTPRFTKLRELTPKTVLPLNLSTEATPSTRHSTT